MAKKTKLHTIRARVSKAMKRQVEELAERKGEAEAVLIREALTQYIEKHRKEAPAEPGPEPKPPTKQEAEENRRRRVGFHPTNKRLMAVKHFAKAVVGSASLIY
jgi:hypothetical protein